MRTAIRIQFPISNRAEVVEESPRPLEANVSHYEKIFEPGNNNTVNGFQLSSANKVAAQLSSRHTFFGPDGYSGYLSGNISEDSVECNFKLESWRPDVTRLYITFDRASGEYAKTIKLQCEDITILVSNNTQVFVGIDISAFDEVYGTVTMTLSDWSVPGHSFKVTNISFIPDIYAVDTSIISFKCSQNLLDAELSINPGVCEQYADIELYDKDNILHTLAADGTLYTDATAQIEGIDDDGTIISLGRYIVSDWQIEQTNTVVRISCRDRSYLFNKVTIRRAMVATRSVDALLRIVFDAARIQWSYLDAETRERCMSISIPDSWYTESKLDVLLDKICAVGLLRMYWYLDTFYVGRCV